MSTSTLRVLIVIAALALGVVVLREAFPGTPLSIRRPTSVVSPLPTRPSPSPSPTPSPSPSPSPTKTEKPKPKPKPRVAGVEVLVLNGTHTDGLATMVSERLKEAGYTLEEPGNLSAVSKTTVYYRKDHKVDAEFLQKKQFPDAEVAPALKTLPKNVDIIVVLGLDYTS